MRKLSELLSIVPELICRYITLGVIFQKHFEALTSISIDTNVISLCVKGGVPTSYRYAACFQAHNFLRERQFPLGPVVTSVFGKFKN